MRNDKKMFKDFIGDDIVSIYNNKNHPALRNEVPTVFNLQATIQLNISQRIDASDESPLCPSLVSFYSFKQD